MTQCERTRTHTHIPKPKITNNNIIVAKSTAFIQSSERRVLAQMRQRNSGRFGIISNYCYADRCSNCRTLATNIVCALHGIVHWRNNKNMKMTMHKLKARQHRSTHFHSFSMNYSIFATMRRQHTHVDCLLCHWLFCCCCLSWSIIICSTFWNHQIQFWRLFESKTLHYILAGNFAHTIERYHLISQTLWVCACHCRIFSLVFGRWIVVSSKCYLLIF